MNIIKFRYKTINTLQFKLVIFTLVIFLTSKALPGFSCVSKLLPGRTE